MENMEAQKPPQETPTQNTQPLKALSCTKIMLFSNLISRIFTVIFLLIALIVLATNVGFDSIQAYRYMMAIIIFGFVYTLVQIGSVLYQVITGNRLFKGNAILLFDFYADMVLSGLLATGAGAGFGFSVDLKSGFDDFDIFVNKGAATASLLLIAYFFSEASQIVSSYKLPKKDC